MTHPTAAHEHNDIAHIASKKVLLGTGAALFILTGVTVWAAGLNLGNVDLWAALIIATIKGTLVAMFFMHLRYDRSFHTVVFLIAFVFVAIFIGFALMDRFQYDPTIDFKETLPQFQPKAN